MTCDVCTRSVAKRGGDGGVPSGRGPEGAGKAKRAIATRENDGPNLTKLTERTDGRMRKKIEKGKEERTEAHGRSAFVLIGCAGARYSRSLD